VVRALLLAGALAGPLCPASGDASILPPAPFDDLSRRASEAREAGRLEEAATLYRDAVTLQPAWVEGWWYLGTMAYERDRFQECRDSFRELLELEPKAAPAWALRGLCEFQLGDHTSARAHLDEALSLGPLEDETLGRVVVYHQALLLIQDSQFERALAPLTRLVQTQTETPELVEACGLLLLRRARLPPEIPGSDRELVVGAGRAYCAHVARKSELARRRFEALIKRYPRQTHLHYGLGLSLAQQGLAEAIEQFRRETALHPEHVLAHVELAFNLLNHGRPDEAVRAAEAAVRLDPEVFVTHLALGRALVATGDLTLGTFELESAARLAPGSPDVFFALARAYARAGRKDDADRASARFRDLEAARRSETLPP
jgi:tetratricopeptide (TPR) repeat protein